MKPIIAIVGRANVGKSTLFNRLVGRRMAIVQDEPGTTRDRVFSDTMLLGREVTLVDTGGIDPSVETLLNKKIKQQVTVAIMESDLVIFLVDIKGDLTATDFEIADILRKSRKPVVLAANKADNMKLETQLSDLYQLGLDSPIPISAYHERGINTLTDRILELLPAEVEEEPVSVSKGPKLAIVGRPNAGKSMLLNSIIGEERVIVDETPGTTRDAVDTIFTYKDQEITLIDTAGIKRRGRSGVGIDFFSIMRSLRAIDRCDIALLVTDATEFLTAQDAHIAGFIKQALKGMIFIVNKWDIYSGDTPEEYTEQLRYRMKFMNHIPVLYTSAKMGKGVNKIIPAALDIWFERQKQISNSVIDKLIKQVVDTQAPPRKGMKRLDIVRAYQDGINPPSFSFLVNDPELVHFSYRRFLENKLRQTFGFSGTSIKFNFKKAPPRKYTRSDRMKPK
jgi:GTPase